MEKKLKSTSEFEKIEKLTCVFQFGQYFVSMPTFGKNYDTEYLRKIIASFLKSHKLSLREKCANTEFFLVRIFPYSD